MSGLLFALPLLPGDSRIELSSPLESAPYVEMSLSTLARFGVTVEKTPGGYRVPGGPTLPQPGPASAGRGLVQRGLLALRRRPRRRGDGGKPAAFPRPTGDRAVVQALEAMGARVETGEDWVRVGGLGLRGVRQDLRQTPDLGPVLALTAAFARGGKPLERRGKRLRMKESGPAGGCGPSPSSPRHGGPRPARTSWSCRAAAWKAAFARALGTTAWSLALAVARHRLPRRGHNPRRAGRGQVLPGLFPGF